MINTFSVDTGYRFVALLQRNLSIIAFGCHAIRMYWPLVCAFLLQTARQPNGQLEELTWQADHIAVT